MSSAAWLGLGSLVGGLGVYVCMLKFELRDKSLESWQGIRVLREYAKILSTLLQTWSLCATLVSVRRLS